MNTTTLMTSTTLTTSTKNDVEGLIFILLALGLYFGTIVGLFCCFYPNYRNIDEPRRLRSIIVFPVSLESKTKDYIEIHKYATEEVCGICLESKNMVRTDCKHIYCDECLQKWMDRSNTCPLCRAEF